MGTRFSTKWRCSPLAEPDPFDGPLRIAGKRGETIQTLEVWEHFAAPAGGSKQWRNYRSAKEEARAWTDQDNPRLPAAVEMLLDTTPSTSQMTIGLVQPEARLPLEAPAYKGNTRNVDVAVYGRATGVATFVGIEAKADESFGPRLKAAFRAASSARSKRRQRINALSKAVLGRSFEEEPDALGELRYQLLHGLAGTVHQAERSGALQAVFVIHEFRSNYTSEAKLNRNDEALRNFLAVFDRGQSPTDQLLSIGKIPGLGGRPVDTFIGKAVTNLANRCGPP
jgi:hypothetical protein